MTDKKEFDAIIVGGSYAGLSAAMTLGRSLRSVLVIDSGKPCNQQTPHSHNFLTQDGAKPQEIADLAKSQVLGYPKVSFLEALVVSVSQISNGFKLKTHDKQEVHAKKILFATGVKDLMPDITGFAECWGISVLHCPYCHGYEVSGKDLGIIANGDAAFDLCTLIQHWSPQLTLFTNGKAELTDDQRSMINKLNIKIEEKEIEELKHNNGYLKALQFVNGSQSPIDAIFSRVSFEQHCKIPLELGCQTTEGGHIEVDFFQKTNIEGVFCAGDNTTPFRTVSLAVSSGTKAGVRINMELLYEELPK